MTGLLSLTLLAALAGCMAAATGPVDAAGAMVDKPASNAAGTPAPLACTLQAPVQVTAGQPVVLHFSLRNTGTQPLQLLKWGTPFEATWFAPYVQVTRDGVVLSYGGPSVKRGDPQATDYLPLAAGAVRNVSVALAPAFDTSRPGRYAVQPQIVLHDVIVGSAVPPPRPRADHVGQALSCPPVTVQVGG